MLINNNIQTHKKRQSFGNLGTATTQVLNFLNTSPAIGATCVDLGAMSAPRTIVDISRNPDAGVETGVRECSGTVNHAAIGAYGMAATALLSGGLNKAYNVNSNKVFANFDSINTLGDMWSDVVKSSPVETAADMRKKFFSNILDNVVATTQNQDGRLVQVSVDKPAKRAILQELSDFIDKNPKAYTLPKKLHNNLKSLVVNSTAAENGYLLKTAKHQVSTDLDTLLKTSFSLSKLFSEKKPLEEFKKATNIDANTFIKSLKNTKLRASLLGVSIGMAIGASVQPFNVWLTKKRTGKEGFVGVEGGQQDMSVKFLATKTAATLGFLGFGYYSIMSKAIKLPLKKQIPVFLNKLQFNGLVPSIPQFKAIYAFTVSSRLFAARDKNELRESATKDFLGFTNWLILGDFVQKLVATAKNNNLTNYDEKVHGKGLFNKIFNLGVRVKTHDEILFEELKKAKLNHKELHSVDGKMLSSKELLAKFSDKLPNLKTRIRGKNIAQVSGYLYSAVVLGVLIPKLNIWITNNIQAKKKHDAENSAKFIKLQNKLSSNSFSNFS